LLRAGGRGCVVAAFVVGWQVEAETNYTQTLSFLWTVGKAPERADDDEPPDIQVFTQARQEVVRKRAELIRAKSRARYIIDAAEREDGLDPPSGAALRQELAARADALKGSNPVIRRYVQI
jgi:hypothetical protein